MSEQQANTQAILWELDEINRGLAYIQLDVTERGYITPEEIEKRRELYKRSVDLTSQVPENIDNKS